MKPVRSPVKIVVFGDLRSGKTTILQHLLGQAPSPTYKATFGYDFHQHALPEINTRLTFWDCTGNPQHKQHVLGAQMGSHVGLYCINLSEEIDLHTIKTNIEAYYAAAHHPSSLICIGTHADKLDNAGEKLKNLQRDLEDHNVKQSILTSVKENIGMSDLKRYLFETCEAHSKHINQTLIWEETIKKLKNDMFNSPPFIQKKVLSALNKLSLIIGLSSPNLDIKKQAIDEFVTTCRPLLANEPPRIMTRVLSIATVALVTLVGAAIGFAIGSVAGGPAGSIAIGVLVGFIIGCAVANSVEQFCHTHGFFAGGKRCKSNLPAQVTNPIDTFAASI